MNIIHEAGQQGPLAAGQAYTRLTEKIALDALIGDLPDAATKEQFYAAHAGIFADARRSIDRSKQRAA